MTGQCKCCWHRALGITDSDLSVSQIQALGVIDNDQLTEFTKLVVTVTNSQCQPRLGSVPDCDILATTVRSSQTGVETNQQINGSTNLAKVTVLTDTPEDTNAPPPRKGQAIGKFRAAAILETEGSRNTKI
jgi:hypothetical protein